MVFYKQNLNYFLTQQVNYILVVRHKDYFLDLPVKDILNSTFILSFPKLLKPLRYFMFFLFNFFVPKEPKASILEFGEFLFYSRLTNLEFHKIFLQLVFWISKKKLKYKKDYDIYFTSNGIFSLQLTNIYFLVSYLEKLGIINRHVHELLIQVVLTLSFKIKSKNFIFFKNYINYLTQYLK